MTKNDPSFTLRLPKSTRDKAMVLAEDEGVSLNHFIVLAVAEKIVRAGFTTGTLKPEPGKATGTKLGTKNRRQLSAAARKRIGDAQRARWAKQKAVK